MKNERTPPEGTDDKDVDRHLTLGTSQSIADAGDGTARPLDPNDKEHDPDVLLSSSGETAENEHIEDSKPE